jgi:hypothetical protein
VPGIRPTQQNELENRAVSPISATMTATNTGPMPSSTLSDHVAIMVSGQAGDHIASLAHTANTHLQEAPNTAARTSARLIRKSVPSRARGSTRRSVAEPGEI